VVFLIGMAKTRNDPFLRKGNVIRYRIDYNTPWKVGTVINRAAKRTSKLKKYIYNVSDSESGDIISIDLLIHKWKLLKNNNHDDINDIESQLLSNWVNTSSPIAYAGVDQIYKHYKSRISRRRIEELLTTIPTYTKFKETKNLVFIVHVLYILNFNNFKQI